MNVVIDTESTIFAKGSAFSRRNRLCYMGTYPEGGAVSTYVADQLPDLQRAVDAATLLIGFNIKHDLHWLRRCGIGFENKRVWDCQIAYFLLQAQRTPFPSLEEVSAHYGGHPKLNVVKRDYWDKGIDTPDVPRELMLEYLEGDLRGTMDVYLAQRKLFEEGDVRRLNLFILDMQDLLVLADMEWNGLKFDTEKAREESVKISGRIAEIESQLMHRCPNAPINWDSVDHVSAYLYGGTITLAEKEPVGFFKTGAKIGQVRYRWKETEYPLPRLVEPLEGTALKRKAGEQEDKRWGTGEDVLKQLKNIPEVDLLLERAKLVKLLDYLTGFPDLIVEKDWEPNTLHGRFNQCVARTGRLSSSDPNLQNLPDPALALVETRYD